MAQEIPFHNQQASGLDELGGGSPFAMNVVIDPANKTVRRRPGVAALSEAPAGVIDATGISGVYKTIEGRFYAVGNVPGKRSIYRIADGDSTSLSLDAGETLLDGHGRPDFAETEMLLVIAGGSRLQKVELTDDASSRLGAVATPAPHSSHIIANSQRLVANDVVQFRGHIRGSDLAQGKQTFEGHENWTNTVTDTGGSITVTAEAKTDAVVSLHENTNEIFAFGSTTLQVFAPDPQFGYVPVATREVGCSAPYSVIKIDQEFAWLDHLRRFVISDGRGFSVISDPIKATLDSIADVSDCFGYRVVLNNIDCMVWTFPTDGRTFVFQKGSGWGQWQGWDPVGANWRQFSVLSHFHEPGTGVNIVGTRAGFVGQLQMGAGVDVGDPLPGTPTTGTVTINGNPDDGDTLTIEHNGTSYVFEYDGAGDGVETGHIEVPLSANWGTQLTGFRNLVNTSGVPFSVTSAASGGDGLAVYEFQSAAGGPLVMDAIPGGISIAGEDWTLGTYLSDGETPIVARVATGYLDRGTPMRKACKRVTLKFRRGDAETSGEPTGAFRATLRWRDRPGPWSEPLFVSLGNSTDRDAQWTRRSLGVYRERQWLLEYSGEADMVLISADEEFEVNED